MSSGKPEIKEVNDTQSNTNQQISIKIGDIYFLALELEKAIKRKAFAKEEIPEIYPVWNNVMKFCEEVKRKTEVEKLYNDEEKSEEKSEETTLKKPVEKPEENPVENPTESVE